MSPSEVQTTLAAPVSLAGRGIHTGVDCRLTVLPAGPDHGIRFARVDLEGRPEIPADIAAAAQEGVERQTILHATDRPEATVCTVEHLLAALLAQGIDNARIEMDAAEAPIGDGSAAEIAGALARAGVRDLDGTTRHPFCVTRPVSFAPEEVRGVEYTAWPSEHLILTYFLQYDHPVIGTRVATFVITPETFQTELAPARTFCTIEEVEFLRSKGLIRGGDVGNAIVVGRDRILNTELRWENELARHKLLDFLGDLSLLGAPARGHFLSHRGGHFSNARFVQYLRKEFA